MLLCDTGPLVAAALSDDPHHHQCTSLLNGVVRAGRRVVTVATVVAEAGFLIERNAGPSVEADFLAGFSTTGLGLLDLLPQDLVRMAELVRQYRDFPLGTTDASLIAVAERLGLDEIATLDRRHFGVAQPRHVQRLRLLPSQP